VLPITSLTWWLVLAALRLIISRLPFLPNKDVVFAGVAVFTLGREGQIAALMTMMAGLILLLHILVATAFAIADLMSGGHDAHRAA
jgi:predicted Co/Zn/Cd cation transporter (cation efflux family)